MALTQVLAMIRKDLQVHYSDRRAVIMNFVAPIAIASFLGAITGGRGTPVEPAKIPIAIVDQDGSTVTKAIVAAVQDDKTLQVTVPSAEEARQSVKRGDVTVAVVIPSGFGEASGLAFFGGGAKPDVSILYDPSHRAEMGLVRGLMTQHVMEAVSREMFGGSSGRKLAEQALLNLDKSGMPDGQRMLLRELLTSVQKFYTDSPETNASTQARGGITLPYSVKEEEITGRDDVPYNGYAHSFAGMGIQFLLFAMIDMGVGILLERQRGLWKRLRSAPISRTSLLLGKALSSSAIAMIILIAAFLFAGIVFGVRIQGSVAGFLAVCMGCALMAATFGLLVASIGQTPGGSRGVASLAVLLMVMLGGAWMPTFIFPAWLQRLTVVMPTRWAVDGLDAMTWRGLDGSAAIMPTVMLIGFAILFGSLALARFRWEEA
jgi:linearmycin/streptolysin S transport system permease protein